jgi:intein/homing endonuclease
MKTKIYERFNGTKIVRLKKVSEIETEKGTEITFDDGHKILVNKKGS